MSRTANTHPNHSDLHWEREQRRRLKREALEQVELLEVQRMRKEQPFQSKPSHPINSLR